MKVNTEFWQQYIILNSSGVAFVEDGLVSLAPTEWLLVAHEDFTVLDHEVHAFVSMTELAEHKANNLWINDSSTKNLGEYINFCSRQWGPRYQVCAH